jgi:hypothetical protein
MISCELIHVCMNSQEAAGSGGLLILVLVFGWLILTIRCSQVGTLSRAPAADSVLAVGILHSVFMPATTTLGGVDSLLDGVDPGNATPIACVVLTAAVAS